MFRKTVDGVLAQFTKAITDLRKVAEQSAKDVNDAEIAIKEANDKKLDAELEAKRALSVVDKLEALLK